MSEDKMREVDATALETRIVAGELEAARMHGEGVAQSIQGLLEQLREYKKGATFWHTAYLELSDVKDAEIEKYKLAREFDAATDDAEWEPPHPIFLMAQENDELRSELVEAKKEIAARDLMIKDLREALAKAEPFIGYGASVPHINKQVEQTLAKSEHHNSRALEKMLLEAELKGLENISGREWTGRRQEVKAKLAELNKE